MTLHLLRHPENPLVLETLRAQTMLSLHASAPATTSAVVLLSPTGEPPSIPGCRMYRLAGSSTGTDAETIDYARLVEMIFAADKVIAW